jgi:hypothetical protein
VHSGKPTEPMAQVGVFRVYSTNAKLNPTAYLEFPLFV